MRLKSIRKAHISKLAKRATAFVLALSMVLPGLPAFGAGSFTEPVKLTGEEEAPTIIIELNAVVNHELPASATEDEIKASLTGELEVVLKVKTGTITTTTGVGDGAETTVTPQLFNNVLVALEYSHWLTPSSFSGVEIKGITDAANLNSIKNMVNMESLKLNKNIATVVAQVSSKGKTDVTEGEGDDALTTTVPSGGGYLILGATAGRPLELTAEGDIVLGAVTFTYPLGSNESEELQPIASAASNYLRDDSSAQLIRLVNPSVFFDDDGDEITGAMAAREVTYNSATNSMYYSDAYYEAESDYINAAAEADLTEAEAAAVDTDGTIKVPKLGIFAADPDYTGSDPEEAYNKSSRLFNLLTLAGKGDVSYEYQTIQEHQVNFSLVNKVSYNFSSELDPSKYTSIVYVDWNNKILGTQVVPKETDVRDLVNTYVAQNFIYRKGGMSLVPTTEEKVASLDRLDTYRGKYPATTPMKDGLDEDDLTADELGALALAGITTVTNTVTKDEDGNYDGYADKYPLTNKLDYVFYKRPMEHTTPAPDPTDPMYATGDYVDDGSLNPDYISDLDAWNKSPWIQKSETTPAEEEGAPDTVTPAWDLEHPFAYGWAQCTVENYQDTWTTLGSRGELSDYAVNGDGLGTVSYEKPEMNFQFADLEKGFTEDRVVLKAIYEPGTYLAPSEVFVYRPITLPYYNKWNGSGSSRGGAYRVSFWMERSTTEQSNPVTSTSNVVRGAWHARDPVIRQDTTYDQSSIVNEDLNVLNSLPNASLSEGRGSASAYTKVPVENEEIFDVALTLPSTFNRVSFILEDQSAGSFVASFDRSTNNYAYYSVVEDDHTTFSEQWVASNYNYKDNDSHTGDQWYDAPYKYREGSYGYILFGTLNSIMEQATKEITPGVSSSFYQYANIVTLADANISLTGDPLTQYEIDEGTDVLDRILDAARLAKSAHEAGNDEWWNVEHDHAELTYHQLMNYILNGGSTLLTDAAEASPVLGLNWCHLHVNCASGLDNLPENWDDLLEAARGDSSPIRSLSNDQAEDIAHLRHFVGEGAGRHLEGYSPTGLQNAFTSAVAALDAAAGNPATPIRWTWDDVQDYILRGAVLTDAVEHSKANYWWYDGKEVTFNSLGQTVAAAMDAITAVELPDGNSSTRTAKINQLESIFDANVEARGDDMSGDVTTAWRNATKNLAVTRDVIYTPEGGSETIENMENATFESFEDFRDLLIGALTEMKDAGIAPLATDAVDTATNKPVRRYWNLIQYYILNDSTFSSIQLPEMDNYWWYDAGIKIVDFITLFKAAKGGKVTNDNFSLDDLYNAANPIYEFRSTFAGVKYMSIQSFIDDFSSYAADESEAQASWERAQYHLIHGGFPVVQTLIEPEASSYYWWKDDGSYDAVDFTIGTEEDGSETVDRANALAEALIKAAFAKKYNGNDDAWNKLIGDDFADIMRYGRLVSAKGEDTSSFPNDFTTFSAGDESTVTTAIMNMLPTTLSITKEPARVPALNWHQIQNYLLESPETVADAEIETDTNYNYWWKKGNTPGAEPQDDFATLISMIADVAAGTDDGTALIEWLTEDRAANMNLTFDGSEPIDGDSLAAIPWGDLNYSDITVADLTWYQVEGMIIYTFLIGAPMFSADAEITAVLQGDFGITDPPDWWDDYLALLGEITPLSLSLRPLAALEEEKTAATTVNTDNVDSVLTFLSSLEEKITADPEKYADVVAAMRELLAGLETTEEPEVAEEAASVTAEAKQADTVTAPSDSTSGDVATPISDEDETKTPTIPADEETEDEEKKEEVGVAKEDNDTKTETTPADTSDENDLISSDVITPLEEETTLVDTDDLSDDDPDAVINDDDPVTEPEDPVDPDPPEDDPDPVVPEDPDPPEVGPDTLSYLFSIKPLKFYLVTRGSPPRRSTTDPPLLLRSDETLTTGRTTR